MIKIVFGPGLTGGVDMSDDAALETALFGGLDTVQVDVMTSTLLRAWDHTTGWSVSLTGSFTYTADGVAGSSTISQITVATYYSPILDLTLSQPIAMSQFEAADDDLEAIYGSEPLHIVGTAYGDVLLGNSGDDLLDGGGGGDTMRGGPGNDTYVVNDTDPYRLPTVLFARGNSWVVPDVLTFTEETGTFTPAFVGDNTGDGLVDYVNIAYRGSGWPYSPTDWYDIGFSTKAGNILPGYYPAAQSSSSTADFSIGGDGRGGHGATNVTVLEAVFDYSSGAPALVRFTADFEVPGEFRGRIAYNYSQGTVVPEVVTELPNEGTDTVRSSIPYTLPANVEHLILTGSSNVNGTGNELSNEITGNDGNNVLIGRGGNDRLDGAGGNDEIYVDGSYYVAIGGAGADTLDFSQAPHSIAAMLTLNRAWHLYTDAPVATLYEIENVVGTRFIDYIEGDGAANALSGSGGNDYLIGRAGDDLIEGGEGNDLVYADEGDDAIYVGQGFDQVHGGVGTDTLDFVRAGVGVAAMLSINQAWNLLTDEKLVYVWEVEGLSGSPFSDYLEGDGNANRLWGGAGDDFLVGAGGNDALFGQDGADTFYVGVGVDSAEGGAGSDTVDFSQASVGIAAMLTLNRAWNILTDAGVSTFSSIENLSGSPNADYLEGDPGANRLVGAAGNDMLLGGGGNDVLIGGLGDDLLYGGAGDDTVQGFEGADTIYAGLGYDRVEGGSGADTLDLSAAAFGVAVMLTISRTWNIQTDALVANHWSIENVVGTAFGDYIVGDSAANRLSGGAGNDWLLGMGGADTLAGGAGVDTFEYSAIGEGIDHILDFTRGAGGDRLDIRHVLTGYSGSSNVNDFVRLSGATSTTVAVNADGVGTDFVDLVTLDSVAYTGTLLNDMLAQGNLVLS